MHALEQRLSVLFIARKATYYHFLSLLRATPFSKVFQSHQDDGKMKIKGCVQWNYVCLYCLQQERAAYYHFLSYCLKLAAPLRPTAGRSETIRLFGAVMPYSVKPRGYKTIFMLRSFEHEILNAHKHKNIKKFSFI